MLPMQLKVSLFILDKRHCRADDYEIHIVRTRTKNPYDFRYGIGMTYDELNENLGVMPNRPRNSEGMKKKSPRQRKLKTGQSCRLLFFFMVSKKSVETKSPLFRKVKLHRPARNHEIRERWPQPNFDYALSEDIPRQQHDKYLKNT